MTSYTLSPVWGAGAQLFDNSGNVLTGGKIETYEAGTTTPAATYIDPIGNTFNSNPIIANASGRLSNEIWLSVGATYKFVLKDANNVLIATYDNIPSSPQPPIINDASSISYEQGYTVTAGAFTVGATYLITSVGTTNFVGIGAAANVTGILFTATGVGSGNGTAEYSRTVQAKLQESVSVKDFGAVGDGVADDTTAINAAILALPAHGVLYAPPGTYNVTQLTMKSNMTFVCDGLLQQTTAPGLETFTTLNQDSAYALINCNGVTNVTITARTNSNYESVLCLTSSNITLDQCNFSGNTTNNTFPAFTTFQSQNIVVTNTKIYNFGTPRTTLTAQLGAGMRHLNSSSITISNNEIYQNGNNAIFLNNSWDVSILNNRLHDNGLSGVQIGSDTVGLARNYLIDGNYVFNNSADCIDVNFDTLSYPAYIKISNNFSFYNGWVGVTPTADGAGIATIIGAQDTVITNNRSTLSNKGAVNIFNVAGITIQNNTSDKEVSVQSNLGKINILYNTFSGVSVVSGATVDLLNIVGNNISNIALPDGTTINKLYIDNNDITNATLNFNLTGHIDLINNRLTSPTGNETALSVSAAVGLNISNNLINHQSSTSDCISIASGLVSVTIYGNEITSKNVAINDAGSSYILVENNNIIGVGGGYVGAICYGGSPSNAMIRGNTFNSPSNSIKVTSGTLFLDRNNTIAGSPDYGTATVQNALYA